MEYGLLITTDRKDFLRFMLKFCGKISDLVKKKESILIDLCKTYLVYFQSQNA